ncbi:Uncharacterised protein [Mycobacteroides abscessus subsp. abscessus]|nr:Uncharacterised protein [Mycobacteroides abscessus subsp. abscessus]
MIAVDVRHLDQAPIVGGERVGVTLLIRHADQLAFKVVRPAVICAGKATGNAVVRPAHPCAAVSA